jgi:DNA-binding MarR family transcriptional regulator
MARSDRGPAAAPLSVEEEAFLRAWSRAAMTVPRALDADLMAAQGMSLSEYTVLMHLSEAADRSMRMGDLACACALSLSGMSRVVGRLEGQGLVVRERYSCDGRGLNAVLTDAGLGRLRGAWPTHLTSVRRHIMDHLGELDLPVVTAALRRFASDTSARAVLEADTPAPERANHAAERLEAPHPNPAPTRAGAPGSGRRPGD